MLTCSVRVYINYLVHIKDWMDNRHNCILFLFIVTAVFHLAQAFIVVYEDGF